MRGYAIPGSNRDRKFSEARGDWLCSSLFGFSRFSLFASMIAGLFAFTPVTASADSVNDLAQVCSGCHGEKGVPIDKSIPVIWGQRREYILKELLDFKTGHRKNETMAGIVDSLTKTDMEALATYFSKQQWPKLDQPAAPADVAHQAQEVFSALNCRGCHQDHFQGDYVRPSLRGQQEDYLLKTMTDFHTGERNNYPGMVALMKSLDESQLKPVATYLAGLPPEVPVAGE
ncbi:MAG: cytochrome C [Proteobacteria bacterium]|nr:cytochrome C [Pseudomonadota bacterium]